MAIDASTILKTSNVIQISNAKFSSYTDKKLYFVDEDFTGVPRVENSSSNLIGWLNSGMGNNYENYSYENASGTNKYGAGFLTYAKLIDLRTRYSQGAKYIYALGTRWLGHTIADKKSYNWGHGPVCLFKYENSTYKQVTGESQSVKVLNNIAIDEIVALNGNFDAILSECIYPLETIVNSGYYYALIHSANRSRGRVEWNGGYTIANYPNTAIDKPIIRWIYEE